MAVSAHASLLSFLHLLDHINHPSLGWLQLDQRQVRSGHQMVTFLLDLLCSYDSHHLKNKVIEGLMGSITEAADEAEAMINSRVVDLLRNGWRRRTAKLVHLSKELNRAIDKIDSIKNQIMLAKGEEHRQPEISFLPATARGLLRPGKSRMVGFDGHLAQIVNKLTGSESGLQIITITGMGGTGKTTLATNVYEHPYIVTHFDRRIWVTISQEYDLYQILQTILTDLGNKGYSQSLSELGDRLHKALFGRRYLIVMDDVWSIEACEDFKKFFPDYENRSRLMVTTRSSNVATHIGSHDPYPIGFLDEHNSWKLFCETVFLGESCPPELEEIGNNIVQSCRGLPLAIAVVGGLLAKSNMRHEFWELVAKDVNSYTNSADDEHCLNILSLSYMNLPIHLKPCFLYLGRFREDEEISVPNIIRMWIAEGFVKPAGEKNLEQVSKEYLEDLAGRNMVIIRRWGSTGRVKSFILHDLLRDFCQRRSPQENFMFTPRVQVIKKRQAMSNLCFYCGVGRDSNEEIQLPCIGLSLNSQSIVRTLVCRQCRSTYPRLSGVRVTDMFSQTAGSHQYLLPSELSYLQVGDYKEFDHPCLIHLHWRLQTLIITGHMYHPIPLEIWELPQLRHLDMGKYISFPKNAEDVKVGTKEIIVLENLHAVMGGEFRLTDEMLKRTPNLKKLKIWYKDYELPNFLNICRLIELEVLSLKHLSFFNPIVPDSLKRLVLRECQLFPEDMMIISSLPSLEVLHLNLAVKDFEWYPVEGGFLQLKVLNLKGDWLTLWEAEAEHFPRLEVLKLKHTNGLKEIPSGIGYIDTLHSIYIWRYRTKDSFMNSVKLMVDEQQELGNESIQVYMER